MAEDGKTTAEAPLQPLVVTVIGTGTGNGGPAPLVTGTEAVTPLSHQPNLLTLVVSPLTAIGVRFISQFLTSIGGFLTLAMVPAGDNAVLKAIQAADFLTLVYTAAGLSLAPAGLDLIKNLATIFGKLENKYPIMTGNV